MTSYVLVHGAMVGAWNWHFVVPRLRAAHGVSAVAAPDLPGHGTHSKVNLSLITLDHYVQAVVEEIEGLDLRDVVLVAHSLGGIVAPGVVARLPQRVRHVLFVSAVVPPEGKSALDAFGSPRWMRSPMFWLTRARTRGLPVPVRMVRQLYYSDLTREQRHWILAHRLTPEPVRPLEEPISLAGLTVPTTYVYLTRDRALWPRRQRAMVMNLDDPELLSLDTGHNAPLSQPDKLADLLLRYA